MKTQAYINNGHRNIGLFSQAVAWVLIAILPSVTLAAGQTYHGQPDPRPSQPRKPLVSVVSPTAGGAFQSKSVSVLLDVSAKVNRRSVDITLNGKNVTSAFRDSGACLGVRACRVSAVFTALDGLLSGANRLSVHADGRDARPEDTGVSFTWKPSLGLDLTDPTAMQLAPSVGFTTVAPGGQQATGLTWFQIYSNALDGGTRTFPKANYTLCGTNYQIIQIDRQKLTEKSYSCADDDKSLESALQSFPAGDLIVVGTVFGHNSQSALNTKAIGGTDYTDATKYPSWMYPEGYMIVGVAGADAGQAYENYVVYNDGFTAQLSGILTLDGNNNYNYHPSDNVTYSVDAVHSKITVNGVVYTPPSTLTNGFWLLKLRRWDFANEQGCSSNDGGTTYPNCGDALDTTTAAGMASLVTDLSNANRRHLVFLVAVGSPFTAAVPPSADLNNVIEAFGGSRYTLNKMPLFPSTTYTILSCSDPLFSKAFVGGSAVVSSSLAPQQTGSIIGVMSRDPHTMYTPVSTTQDDVSASSHVDDSFYQIAWTQPGPWPLMDTPGHLGAYRYVSNTIGALLKSSITLDDIRTLYTTSSNADLFTVDFSHIPFPTPGSGGTWQDPVDQNWYTFTSDDLSAVTNQIHTEIQNIQTISNYMYFANGGLKDALIGSTSGAAFDLLGAASAAATDLNQQTSTNVTLNFSNAANMFGAIFSVGAAFLDPEDLPLLGVASGLMWGAGSSALLNPASQAPPNPYFQIIGSVQNIADSESAYIRNMQTAFDTAMDDIFTDWNKLSVVAGNTGVNGKWQINNAATYANFGAISKRSAQIYFYTQIFASVYSLDTFLSQPYATAAPWLIGSPRTEGEAPYQYDYCRAIYPSNGDALGYAVLPNMLLPETWIAGTHDIFYIGGAISNNNTGNMNEQLPTSTYLTIIFGTDPNSGGSPQLNLSSDQFWSPNGPLTRRSGAAAPGWSGFATCHNIGGRAE